ncbi:ATP-binding cassette domain-containing protein [Pseudooceanicola nanhaiensis]|uniref:ATP-binding cassette domain-containing protein n=1 Tax=Pseudooceanicola nanhaiensis TaxID=375761 RepID=UPI001CD5DB81|nr:ATP-binding cassette domain-containing protein [Pseudooceanicola nanhaiensis]MCA0921288.1 ATP-binding cassette domain-containing protein [Pseudooceanicola nanhaiensis]
MDLLLGPNGRRALKIYGWIMLFVVILPVLILVPISFGSGKALTLTPNSWSLEWYRNLLSDRRWMRAASLSFQVALVTTLFATVLGVAAAIGISRIRGRLGNALKIFFIAPMIVPLMVIGVGYYVIFAKLRLLGQIAPLSVAHAMVVLPFVVMPVMSRLASLDPALERASASLGANVWRTLGLVTLPLLVPAIIASAVFAFIFSFDEVVLAQLLAGPRFETLPRKIWEEITQNGLDKTITAISSLQLFLVLAFVAAQALWSKVRARRALVAAPRARSLSAAAVPGATAAGALAGSPSPQTAPAAPSLPRERLPFMSDTSTGRDSQHGFGITFHRMSKFYDGKAAVEDVSLKVEPGEFVTILGPSGSGKTTLLMLIAGFTQADAGHLLLGKRDISLVPPHQRDIGVVFQSYALFPHMNVARNVAYPLRARGMSKDEQARRIKWALSRVHMEDYAERRITQLSGGQQQRVALARAIAFDPRALLMDEPLAALDRNLRVDMQGEIRSLQRSLGQTVVFVTHDQEEAMNMSDRVAVMNDGKLQQVATPRDLYLSPANSFVAGFFGESNLFAGTGTGTTLAATGGRLPLPTAQSGASVLCVRPEVIRLDDAQAPDWALPGRVTDARFLGSTLRIELDSPMGTVIATQPIDGQSTAPAPGREMSISWAPQMSHVMAA